MNEHKINFELLIETEQGDDDNCEQRQVLSGDQGFQSGTEVLQGPCPSGAQ